MCDYIYKKKDDGNLQGVYVLLKATNLLDYYPRQVDSPFTEYKVKIGMAYADAAKRAKQQEFLLSRQANLTVNGISKTVRLYDNTDVIQIRRTSTYSEAEILERMYYKALHILGGTRDYAGYKPGEWTTIPSHVYLGLKKEGFAYLSKALLEVASSISKLISEEG